MPIINDKHKLPVRGYRNPEWRHTNRNWQPYNHIGTRIDHGDVVVAEARVCYIRMQPVGGNHNILRLTANGNCIPKSPRYNNVCIGTYIDYKTLSSLLLTT